MFPLYCTTIKERIPKILLYYIVLVVAIVAVLVAIEELNIHYFGPQFDMPIILWGIVGFIALLTILLISWLVEFILKKLKSSS